MYSHGISDGTTLHHDVTVVLQLCRHCQMLSSRLSYNSPIGMVLGKKFLALSQGQDLSIILKALSLVLRSTYSIE